MSERRRLLEEALSWSLPADALPHIDIHQLASDLLNLLAERDVSVEWRAVEPEVHRER